MQTREEYAEDYPGEPEKAFAAQLVDLREQLNEELALFASTEKARQLRIKEFSDAIREGIKDLAEVAPLLAMRLVNLDENLDVQLIDVPTDDEVRQLRIEHFAGAIRAWLDGQ